MIGCVFWYSFSTTDQVKSTALRAALAVTGYHLLYPVLIIYPFEHCLHSHVLAVLLTDVESVIHNTL